MFTQNFSEHFLLEPVLDGVIALPAGAVTEPFVDVEDVADVAVAALTTDGHHGRTYELTGPRLLGFAEIAAELGAATGRDIVYLPVTPAEYAAAAAAAGVPAEEIEPLTDLFTRIFDGHNAHLTTRRRGRAGPPGRGLRRLRAADRRDRRLAAAQPAGPGAPVVAPGSDQARWKYSSRRTRPSSGRCPARSWK